MKILNILLTFTQNRNEMPKKKVKTKIVYRDAPNPKLPKTFQDLKENSAPVDEETRKEATERLVKLFKAVSVPPEPILDILYRLEIPWRRTDLVIDNIDDSYIIIKVAELEAGEARHQIAGSIVNRLYGDRLAERMTESSEPLIEADEPEYYETEPIPEYEFMEPIHIPATHNPSTGEQI